MPNLCPRQYLAKARSPRSARRVPRSSADAWYWVPLEPNQKSPRDTISLICDDRQLLETRVRRLSSPRIYSQERRSRTRRIIDRWHSARLRRFGRQRGNRGSDHADLLGRYRDTLFCRGLGRFTGRTYSMRPWAGFVASVVMAAFALVLMTDNFHALSDFIYPLLHLPTR